MKTTALCLVAALAMGGSALAAERGDPPLMLTAPNGGPFSKWLSPDSPACLLTSDLKKAGASIVTLTPEQFQFVRAMWVTIPPMSRELPAGETAIEATIGNSVMVALVSGEQSCARFLIPDFIKTMLDDVATGTSPKIGAPL